MRRTQFSIRGTPTEFHLRDLESIMSTPFEGRRLDEFCRLVSGFAGRLPKVPSNVVLHRGWFNQTAPQFAEQNTGPLAFLHVDCDLYSSTAAIFAALLDRIVPGTVVVFDEYFNYPNWKSHEHKAFTEFQGMSGKKFRHIGYSIQQVAVVAL